MALICVVEDEVEVRNLIVEELEDCGHKVVTANDGSAGFDAIRSSKPDMIISDINMPKENGFEMRARLLKADDNIAKIPFLFLSAFADSADIADGMVVGADAYLTKPIDFDLMIEWVDRLI